MANDFLFEVTLSYMINTPPSEQDILKTHIEENVQTTETTVVNKGSSTIQTIWTIIWTVIWKVFAILLITVIGAGITCGGNVILSWWGASWFVEIFLCFIWGIYLVSMRKKGEKIPWILKFITITLIVIIIALGVSGPHSFNI